MRYIFSVDLGGTTVKMAFFSEDGKLQKKWESPTDTREKGIHILLDISVSIRKFLAETGIPKEDVLGIGIGVPGPVDPDGNVNHCVNLGWEYFNIHKELSALTGLPVKAGNDANVAALGEYYMGGGQGCHSMVLATLGTGVGGGIVVDGHILHGFHGAGGEIGHLVLNRFETEKCGCGKYGCAEQYCSATGVVRVATRFLAGNKMDSVLRKIPSFTCKDVFDAYSAGDPAAAEILDRVFQYMGEFLADVCCIVDPEVVVLGGGVSKAGQPLLDGVAKYFYQYVFHAARDVRFKLATLGNDAGTYGALRMALDEFGR